jgi:transcription antitermination factor NusG
MREKSWVVIEITSKGEEEARQGTLKKLLISFSKFKEEDIYVPIIRYGKKPLWLMEGYIFIRSGFGASDYYDLKRSGLVKDIISKIDSQTGLISKGVVSDKELRSMIQRADELGGNFEVGQQVKILSGSFQNMEGEVVSKWHNGEVRMYAILLSFRSVEIITTVDCLSLEG